MKFALGAVFGIVIAIAVMQPDTAKELLGAGVDQVHAAGQTGIKVATDPKVQEQVKESAKQMSEASVDAANKISDAVKGAN